MARGSTTFTRAGQTVGGKLRARLVCEFSADELLVEHPDADQHRRLWTQCHVA
jgi:hypothetical protein